MLRTDLQQVISRKEEMLDFDETQMVLKDIMMYFLSGEARICMGESIVVDRLVISTVVTIFEGQ